jgi:UDP-glucose 4-epimerase
MGDPLTAITSGARADPQPCRVLVTGGAGFIGSHLVDRLLARGDHVTVVDNLSTGRRENLPAQHVRLRFIEADLADSLRALGKGETFDEIYHLAAAVGVKLIVDEPIRSIETNIEQASALFKFALEHGRARRDDLSTSTPAAASANALPGPRVLIASSSEVYGKASKSPFSEDDDVLYGPTTVARWSYACSKAVDEYLAIAYFRQHGLPTVVARFFNTVGPRQVGSYGMVLPRFVRAALAGEPLMVYGDGSQTRCFGDVRDVVAVLPRLMQARQCHGRVFNIGADQPISIADLADLVIKVLGSRSKVMRLPYDQAYGPGFEDLQQRQPDLRRLREAVEIPTFIPLEHTIMDVASTMRPAIGDDAQAAEVQGGHGGKR